MIHIITDTASDFTHEQAKALNIDLIPLTISFGEEEFLDNYTMSHEEFFMKLIETDIFPKTSQIPPYRFAEKFEEYTRNGDEVLCIALSSVLSGTYQSACIAAEEFDGKVQVVDSLNVCIGQQNLVALACQMRDAGSSLGEIAATLEIEKHKIRVIALLDTLEYLKKGGRISATVAVVGTILSIKPVICVEEGAVSMLGKARGSKAGNNLLHEYIEKEANAIDYSRPAALAYSGLSDALLNKYVEDHAPIYKNFGRDLPITSIGATIGTHVGPGAIAVSYFVK